MRSIKCGVLSIIFFMMAMLSVDDLPEGWEDRDLENLDFEGAGHLVFYALSYGAGFICMVFCLIFPVLHDYRKIGKDKKIKF